AIQPPMDKVFNNGPYPIGGDTDTPLQTAMLPNDPFYSNAWSAAWREIIDFSDLSNSKGIHAPGQSGQLASKHYNDLTENWLKGKINDLLWTRGQIEGNAEAKLLLTPN
ncbi:MAG: penicillin acylase family protein, partial [Candidatus Heimdallarchaeota archaeon]|nr:penicillin acylase family protein [Candidatus Heimdallarchaeota archaeon]